MMSLKIVADQEVHDPAHQAAIAEKQQQASRLLQIALAALSERAVIAVGSLFAMSTAASVFALAMSISVNPSQLQLVLLGMYSAFILGLHVAKRR